MMPLAGPKQRYLIPLGLSLLLCALLYLTMGQAPIHADESFCCSAGNTYAAWFEHPFRGGIDLYWRPNHEHPPFGKIIGGIATQFAPDWPGGFDIVEALPVFRLQNLVYCFALSFIMYLWAEELSNRRFAVLAALLTFFLPRLYYYAHSGTLDYPLTVLTFVTCYVFWKGLRNPRTMILCSILLGLTLLTKVNGAFLLAFLGVWLLIAWRKELRRKLGYIVAFAAIPPAMFLAMWPWLWPHPVARTLGYFIWMKHHLAIPVYYLGHTYLNDSPWHYPFVITILTLPLVLLLAIGFYAFRARKTGVDAFLILNALFPIAVIAFLSPCKFDGVRLFLPCFPFITLIAAMGIYHFATSPLRMAAVACALAASVAFAVHEYRQYQECYLNEAVALGGWSPYFETESGVIGYPELAPWLKAHPQAKIHIGMATSDMHRKEFDYDYIILPSQLGAFKTNAWYYYLHKTPLVAIKEANGLQIVGIYSTRDDPK